MVVAYLRGILKPELQHGYRSLLSESVIFEALEAESMHDDIQFCENTDLAVVGSLNEDGFKRVLRQSSLRKDRLAQLKEFDLYCIEDQLSVTLEAGSNRSEFSTIQLFRILESKGILDKLDKHNKNRVRKPIL